MLVLALVAGSATAQTPFHLRVGTVPVDVGAEAYYAADQGYFQRAGLDVELLRLANGPATAAAVASGTLDVGNANSLSLTQAHERGLPFVAIAPAGAYSSRNPTAGLVVSKTSPLRAPADFVGKTIAVATVGSISQTAAQAWLTAHGVDPAGVHFIEMPYSAMDTALAAGRVDGAVLDEPSLDRILSETRLVASVYDAIAPAFLEGMYFSTLDFARAHPDVVRRFGDAIAEAARWANRNPGPSAKILEKYSGVPVGGAHRVFYPERLDPAQLQPLIDAAARFGVLRAPFPAASLFVSGG